MDDAIPDTADELLTLIGEGLSEAQDETEPDEDHEGTHIADIAAQLRDLHRGYTEAMAWLDHREVQEELLRKDNARLKAKLLDLRRAAFPFSDADVATALRRAYKGKPVAATAVARGLLPQPVELELSVRIRTGLALSRLAAQGAVRKIPAPRNKCGGTHRWEPHDTPGKAAD